MSANETAVPTVNPYTRVAFINKVAGNVPSGDWNAIRRQFKIFFSEVVELARAIDARDVHNFRDASADVTVTNCGFPFLMGIDGDADFQAVADSLLTRFDRNYDDAVLTSIKYKDRGVPTTFRETEVDGVVYWATIVTEDCVDQVNGEELTKGKFLKSHKYSTATFTPPEERFLERLTSSADDEAESCIALAHRMLDEKRK